MIPFLAGTRSPLTILRNQKRAKAREKYRYHAISNLDSSTASNDDFIFTYKAPDNAGPYEFKSEDRAICSPLGRAIPQDGRIALGYDLHWLVQEARHHHKRKFIVHYNTKRWLRTLGYRRLVDNVEAAEKRPEEAVEKATRKYVEVRMKKQESGFGSDFKEFGFLRIRDINPVTEANLVYGLAGNLDSFVHVESDIPETAEFFATSENYSWLPEKQELFCQSRHGPSDIARWQRIILCQGLSLTSKEEKEGFCFPFSVFSNADDPIRMAITIHLSGERRPGSEITNPYVNPHNAFHMTFFEWLQQGNLRSLNRSDELGKDLKIGTLFQKSTDERGGNRRYLRELAAAELSFRQSSFTVITAYRKGWQGKEPVSDRQYWTMMILSPSQFFHGEEIEGNKQKLDWHIDVGLQRFNDHIGGLLTEDFMDPIAYSKLLFDDAIFSRSRLYFWIIGCLNEFDILLKDNIKQWQLYRRARIEHLILSQPESHVQSFASSCTTHDSVSTKKVETRFDLDKDLLRLRELDTEAENVRQSLEMLQTDFDAKREKAKALRDGLFNASALMESRSSTRLGMNVQLLTYVSIFYLPLAFCAALWAIPNIDERGTRTPFIVTAILVGAVTYAIVFNLENMAGFFGRLYNARKERLLHNMENDKKSYWREVRDRFEEFPPNEERKTPSEWWVLRYQVSRLFRRKSAKDSSAEEGDL
ncbi:hypothetical protein NLG97_g7021 [Lecanicillium saksenae]|uniref:Uncharacterized protein n=1 Tax=Lecanicillium saksenae TaxID=468837 RepID=A0ACC1QR04_9HYPO|nr:hypothetical protein NLG97_g7021 [Lecanicillium saksenae]